MKPVLCEIRALTVAYRQDARPALEAIGLDIRDGERLAIIGESGSGKSTLARSLAGLLPDGTQMQGHIAWPLFGKTPVAGRDLGFVFQDPSASLNPVLTIGEQVAEGARQHLGLSWKAAYARAAETLERVRLPEPQKIMKAFPHQLSGGQRQRVAIAAAIICKPRLLIADEATSALDVVVQQDIVRLLDELVREAGMTLLFITHDIALASGLADRIAVLRQGRLVEEGPAARLLSEPQDAYTSLLIESHLDLDSPPLIREGIVP